MLESASAKLVLMHPGSKSAGQSSSGTRAVGNFGSYQGAAAGRPVNVPYSPDAVYVVTPVLSSGLSQPVLQADPRFSSTSSLVPAQMVMQSPGLVQGALQTDSRFSGSGSRVPAQMVMQASGVPQAVQTALSSLSYGLPATGYSTVTYVPVDAGSDAGSLQPGAAQSEPQGKSFVWSVDGTQNVMLGSRKVSVRCSCGHQQILPSSTMKQKPVVKFDFFCFRLCIKTKWHTVMHGCSNGSLLLGGKGLAFKQTYWGTKRNLSITPLLLI